MSNTGTIQIALKINDKGVVKSIRQVGTEAEKTGKKGSKAFSDIDGSTRKMTGGIKDSTAAMLKMGTAVFTLAGTTGLGLLVNSSLNASTELEKNAKIAGLSTTAYQELAFAAGQHSITQDALTDGMKELNLRTDEYVQTGAGSAQESFERLGFSQEELNERLKDSPGLLKEIIRRMEDLDTAAQIRIADEIFGGTGGEQFVAMIDAGADALDGLTKEAHALGVVMDEDLIRQSIEAERQMDQLVTVVSINFQTAVAQLAPDIKQLTALTAAWVKQNKDLIAQKVPEYLGNIRDSVKKIKDIYDAVPDDIKGPAGMGLVGTALLGGAAGKTIFALTVINNLLEYTGNSLDDLWEKQKKGLEARDKLFESIKDALGFNDEIDPAALKHFQDVLGITGMVTKSINETTEGIEKYTGVVTKTINEMTQGFDLYNKKSNGLLTEIPKWVKEYEEEARKIIESSFEYQIQLKQDALDRYKASEKAKSEIVAVMQAEINQLVDAATDKAIESISKEERARKNAAANIASAMDSMYADIGLKGRENYDYQKGLLEAQAEEYEKMGIKSELVERWFTERHRELKEQQILDSDDFFAGVKLGLDGFQEDMATWAEAGETMTRDMFSGMTDALTDFVMTGKADFSDLAESIISDLIRISIQQNITAPLAAGASSLLASGVGSLFGFAQGGVVTGASISQYSNQVIDQPTLAPNTRIQAYATGGALFGEAGPEAIMPLTRMPSGNLGVESSAGAAPNVEINITNNGQAVQATQEKPPQWDGEKWVIGIVLDYAANNKGNFRTSLKGMIS
ncbi:phage tail tape measure C-terminal domain-containing protein [Desulfobacula phenolica]|uniref:Phage tail tape measure protein, lambda family n=1 Tax=Desulfobacula phenolica TaxID=90732 RepID=A0A1H2H456_9BACT|nr:phage tail tape measure C-terminal domain-containing protein [Desulfobacula phenolica]SDU26622.1 phage tail tape measure protein, lambda family [Desulfobacula phenolica]